MASATALSITAIILFIQRALAGINIIRTSQFGALNFKKIDGHYLNISRGMSTEVAHFPACANECRKNQTCTSFNLEKNGGKTYCEVLQDDYCNNKDKLVADSNRQVFYIESECCANGCLNGGKCFVLNNKVKRFCKCRHSYGGERCEKQVSKQYCHLFSEKDKMGMTVYVDARTKLWLLDGTNFNEKPKSLSCFGIWILYEDDFSTYSNNLLVESKGETLTNVEAPLYGKTSAIRPVGPLIDPFNKDWLMLYGRPEYFGSEALIENDINLPVTLPEMNDHAESAIMSGTSSWTLYNGYNYNPNTDSVCLKGRSDGRMRMYWTFNTFGLANKVSSVRKGCHSSTIV